MDKTYGDLYLYLEKKFAKRVKREHKAEAFCYTKAFLDKNLVPNASRIIQILSDFGGGSDLEILFNVSWRIAEDIKLTDDIETPVEYALRNKYYTRWHEGMWVSCTAKAKDCHPDINKAYKSMSTFKPNEPNDKKKENKKDES